MNTNIDYVPTKFLIRLNNGKIVGEATSRASADMILNQLTESDRKIASVIPITITGDEVLLG
jgi:hypothetical protein